MKYDSQGNLTTRHFKILKWINISALLYFDHKPSKRALMTRGKQVCSMCCKAQQHKNSATIEHWQKYCSTLGELLTTSLLIGYNNVIHVRTPVNEVVGVVHRCIATTTTNTSTHNLVRANNYWQRRASNQICLETCCHPRISFLDH